MVDHGIAFSVTGDHADFLIDGFEKTIRTRWELYRDPLFNPTTKGISYEEAFAELLNDYFGSTFDIFTRSAIIDEELECFEKLGTGENNFDVIALFDRRLPSLVFSAGEMRWMAYNAVAFLCEVKSSDRRYS